MADKLVYIPNDDTQNYHFCILHQEVETFDINYMNQPITIQWKSPRLLSQRIRKCYYKTLGTSVINIPMSLSLLTYAYFCYLFNKIFLLHGMKVSRINILANLTTGDNKNHLFMLRLHFSIQQLKRTLPRHFRLFWKNHLASQI